MYKKGIPTFTRGTLIDIKNNYEDSCAYFCEDYNSCVLHRKKCKGKCQDYKTIKDYHIVYKDINKKPVISTSFKNVNYNKQYVNLIGQIVITRKDNAEHIVENQDENKIYFSGTKGFVYSAFKDGWIKMKDEKLQEIVINEINKKEIKVIKKQDNQINNIIKIKLNKNNIKDHFKQYLIDRGYKQYTENGQPSTVYDYVKRIDFIRENEGYLSWMDIVDNIEKMLLRYDIGGIKEDDGKLSHNSVINALRRFSEFINELKYI